MKTPLWVVSLLVLGCILVASGCGRKGAPFLPQKSFDVAVLDLRGESVDGSVELRGRISHPEMREMVTGCRVFYVDFPQGQSPCEGCPVEFKGYHGLGPEVVVDQGFFCRVPGKGRGTVSLFQVRLAGPGGVLGPPSGTVRVEVK